MNEKPSATGPASAGIASDGTRHVLSEAGWDRIRDRLAAGSGAGPCDLDGVCTMDDVGRFLAAAFAADPDVTRPSGTPGRFGGKGLRCRGVLFAMPVAEGLAVKLPRDRVAAHCAAGVGRALVMGKRTLRDWIVAADPSHWPALVEEARASAATKAPKNAP